MIKTFESAKLFFKKYPYKIAYKRLYGFPSKEVIESYSNRTGYGWWFDYPTTVEEQVSRANCIRFLRSQPGTKFTNSSMTHVYFETKEVFENASTRYHELQKEHHVPFIDNLAEQFERCEDNVEIKKKLYHKKFRYKIQLKYNNNLHTLLGPLLNESYIDNDNYFLNNNLRRFNKDPDYSSKMYMQPPGHNISYNISYLFRHSNYNSYVIYCKDHIDMQLMAFVASENIIKITKALLRHEIS
jgi:hypothetical protein